MNAETTRSTMTVTEPSPVKLSICIGTFNRARFLREALDSVINQATSECEIVVSDNASADNTRDVLSEYARRFPRLRYFTQSANTGFDRNFDSAVGLARGEYCWLFSDDDLMKPGAIASVLEATRRDYSLILVNGEHKDFTMSNVRVPNFFGIYTNRVYAPGDLDRLFREVGTCLICVCCVVIKRAIWLARDRESHYGSWFIHAAVVLQEALPGETLAIATPLMSLRLGNEQTVRAEGFRAFYMSWPSLVWSSPIAESTKRRFGSAQPWREPKFLLALRAMRWYRYTDYHRWIRPHLSSLKATLLTVLIALLPNKLAHRLFSVYSLISSRHASPLDVIWTILPESFRVVVEPPPKNRELTNR